MESKIIGSKIVTARKKITISQAELAQNLFISPQAVGKWERGESLPDIITLNRLAEILGVDLNYFSINEQHISAEKIVDESIKNHSKNPALEAPKNKPRWNMSQGNWINADFSGLKNLQEQFSSSNMHKCKFVDSDLAKLLLKHNNVLKCDFSDSNISMSTIQGSNFEGNIFQNCTFNETKFSSSYISECDFTSANLTGASIKSGGFSKNIITNTVWNGTSFIDTYISEIVFEGTMDDCSFENCSFKKVTFKNTILTNTLFKNKSLKGIQFINCQTDRMTHEFLKNGKADLSGISILTTPV